MQKFAAHLAHVLNDGEDVVTVQAFALFTRLTATLERREQGGHSGPYDGLTGLRILGPGTTPQEAALFYVDEVLRRPLHLARDEPSHKGHALFLALCRRGLDPTWPDAHLVRTHAAMESRECKPPADFDSVADRLGRLSSTISEGNPAKSTRAASGPLFLCVADTSAQVAEEMSLWDAMTSAPSGLTVLAPGPQFNAFCSVMIKALEAANARFGTLVGLGLSPRDWDDLSVNTAKKASAFLGSARVKDADISAGSSKSDRPAPGAGSDSLANWEQAWKKHQVPGFDSAREFWNSPLGYALRHSQIPIMVDLEEETIVDKTERETSVLDELAFRQMAGRAERAGVLSSFDARLLIKIYQGETIAALAAAPQTRQILGKPNVSKKMLEDYLDSLRGRIAAYLQSLPES